MHACTRPIPSYQHARARARAHTPQEEVKRQGLGGYTVENADVRVLPVDLADLSSVDMLADEVSLSLSLSLTHSLSPPLIPTPSLPNRTLSKALILTGTTDCTRQFRNSI